MSRVRLYLLGAVLITIPSLLLALWSSGAGHGSYFFAHTLFPSAMLTTLPTEGVITSLSAVVAVLQFPVYAVLLAWGRHRNRSKAVVVALMIAHVAAAVISFNVLTGF